MLSDDWTPESVKVKRFRDVEGHWGKEGIGYVIEQGLFGGTSEYTFEPNVSMSRAMFATVLGRLYEDLGGSVEVTGEGAFTDVKADSWYGKYVLWASENGLITGVKENDLSYLKPSDSASRAQTAAILQRYMELYAVI